jgi:hypothetical protein
MCELYTLLSLKHFSHRLYHKERDAEWFQFSEPYIHTRETEMIGPMSTSHTFRLSSRIVHIFGGSGLDNASEP